MVCSVDCMEEAGRRLQMTKRETVDHALKSRSVPVSSVSRGEPRALGLHSGDILHRNRVALISVSDAPSSPRTHLHHPVLRTTPHGIWRAALACDHHQEVRPCSRIRVPSTQLHDSSVGAGSRQRPRGWRTSRRSRRPICPRLRKAQPLRSPPQHQRTPSSRRPSRPRLPRPRLLRPRRSRAASLRSMSKSSRAS